MEEFGKEERSGNNWENRAPAGATRWLVILSVVLFAAAVFAGGYAFEQNAAVSDLKVQNQSMSTNEAQLRSQIDALTQKVAQLTTPPAPPAGEAPANGTAAAKPAAKRSPVPDRRLKQMQSQLTEQQKQLKQTQDDLATARTDLEGKLGSTRDELNGSIAKTHDELVTLEKRSDRVFYEFDLSRSKSFEREGPILLSLRRADQKHQSYDLMMLVDDHQLSKKKVDLYEPIWLHQGDMPQPVQVVANKIDKDHIHGYVSAPKYKESELASNAPPQPAPAADSNSKPGSSASSSSPSSTSSTSTPTSATPSPGH